MLKVSYVDFLDKSFQTWSITNFEKFHGTWLDVIFDRVRIRILRQVLSVRSHESSD